ncbi:hypothetical protein B0F88_105180 [Methylobacter tundripaludum]|uniref:Uncharacterized protein n=1 Tax=Methylobacter tundripaludum TaxID=173365 RepID=A0A2S6H3K0_9GAMM|nr:hypothetical protein B0F88_105180 [Methylobacter tundripaludum]
MSFMLFVVIAYIKLCIFVNPPYPCSIMKFANLLVTHNRAYDYHDFSNH